MAQAGDWPCKQCVAGVQLPLLGKILVSEGSNGTEVLVSSELYSPLLNIWTPAGSQQVPRTSFTDNPNNVDHAQVPKLRNHCFCSTVEPPHWFVTATCNEDVRTCAALEGRSKLSA